MRRIIFLILVILVLVVLVGPRLLVFLNSWLF